MGQTSLIDLITGVMAPVPLVVTETVKSLADATKTIE